MAVYDTAENRRSDYTRKTLKSLAETVDWTQHELIVIDNNSCEETKQILSHCLSVSSTSMAFSDPLRIRNWKTGNPAITLITLSENIGTAKAINRAWKHRKPNQHLIKMDNDCVIHSSGWVDELEQAIERDPRIGIIGLKRKDLMENPNRPDGDGYKSTLRMLAHQNGERWIIVEEVNHVMGTCQMYNWRLIDKIGGMMQPGIYGFDDSLAAVRCKVAGFKNCFLPHIEIDHIDNTETPYWQEKRDMAMADMAEYNRLKDAMYMGTESIYLEL